ncbi:MAG: hypothetical protein Q9200_003116 [Gallowayella weberi]
MPPTNLSCGDIQQQPSTFPTSTISSPLWQYHEEEMALIGAAEDAQDIAAGFNKFLDPVPEFSAEITALISECYAISSALRELNTAKDDPRYYRDFEYIRNNVDIAQESLNYTFHDVRRLFGGLGRTSAISRRTLFYQVWREIDDFFYHESSGPLRDGDLEDRWGKLPILLRPCTEEGEGKGLRHHNRLLDLTMITTHGLRQRPKYRLHRRQPPPSQLCPLPPVLLLTIGYPECLDKVDPRRHSVKMARCLVLFYCAFITLRSEDAKNPVGFFDDQEIHGEKSIYAGKIRDDNFEHALRVFKDRDCGAIRLQASVLRGELKR